MSVSVDWCVSGCWVCCVIKVAAQLSLLSFFWKGCCFKFLSVEVKNVAKEVFRQGVSFLVGEKKPAQVPVFSTAV
jgi:hypothetical protein